MTRSYDLTNPRRSWSTRFGRLQIRSGRIVWFIEGRRTMDRFKELALGRQLILVGGVLLIIDSFFAWQKITFNGIGISASASAWHGWGVLMALLTIAIVG